MDSRSGDRKISGVGVCVADKIHVVMAAACACSQIARGVRLLSKVTDAGMD